MEIHDVQITQASLGKQFTGTFQMRTLVEPCSVVSSGIFGATYYLLVYDREQIIYYSGGSWNGTHPVGSDMSNQRDTHSSALIKASGAPWLSPKPGDYKMRLVLVNGGGWNDILDVYDAPFKISPSDAAPTTQNAVKP